MYEFYDFVEPDETFFHLCGMLTHGVYKYSHTLHSETFDSIARTHATMDSKQDPAHPLARFPVEIWQMIADNLDAFDYTLLQLSSKTCYTSLFEHACQVLSPEGRKLIQWYCKLDWCSGPETSECILCRKPHTRLHSQPQFGSDPKTCVDDIHGVCQGGLRVGVDLMLCGLCWDGLLEDASKASRSHLLTSKSGDDWHHEWNTSWRNGRLRIKTKSILEVKDWRAVRSINWTVPIMFDLVSNLCWCGCSYALVHLQGIMLGKLEGNSNPMSFTAWRRTQVVCQECSALYVVGIRRRQETKTNLLIVTRFHDLSDASARTASLSMVSRHLSEVFFSSLAASTTPMMIAARIPSISPNFDAGWRHEWHSFLRRARLFFSVQFRRDISDSRLLGTESMTDNSTGVLDLLSGLNWCGCDQVKSMLVLAISAKMISVNRKPDTWSTLDSVCPDINSTNSACSHCRALYFVSSGIGKEVKIMQVKRY